MKSLIFYVSVFYDLCKCLLFRFMGGFLLLTRLNEHIICRLISLIVFRLQGVVRFLPFAMLFLKQFLRRGAQVLFGGEDRAETFFLSRPRKRCMSAAGFASRRRRRTVLPPLRKTLCPHGSAGLYRITTERIRTLNSIAGFRVARPRAFIGDSLAHRCFSVRI